MCGDGGLANMREKTLGKKRRDEGIEKRMRNGKGGWEYPSGCGVYGSWDCTSSGCAGWCITRYEWRVNGRSPKWHWFQELTLGIRFTTVKHPFPLPFRPSGGNSCSPPHLSWPQASRIYRQRPKLRISPPRASVAYTKTKPAAPLLDPDGMGC
jgi:hypothetical protein